MRPISGFRHSPVDCLVLSAPTGKRERRGYLSALYTLRANALPPAYTREADIDEFQAHVHAAIRILTALDRAESLPCTVCECQTGPAGPIMENGEVFCSQSCADVSFQRRGGR